MDTTNTQTEAQEAHVEKPVREIPMVRALFDDDDVLLKSVAAIREKGYKIQEVFTPFPVHGLDHALGLKGTRIAIAAFMYGLLGLSTAIAMTYYMMIIDWPMNIGGKPFDELGREHAGLCAHHVRTHSVFRCTPDGVGPSSFATACIQDGRR